MSIFKSLNKPIVSSFNLLANSITITWSDLIGAPIFSHKSFLMAMICKPLSPNASSLHPLIITSRAQSSSTSLATIKLSAWLTNPVMETSVGSTLDSSLINNVVTVCGACLVIMSFLIFFLMSRAIDSSSLVETVIRASRAHFVTFLTTSWSSMGVV